MKIFAYNFVGKAKDWFDGISPRKITNWNLFQDVFTKIFGKKRDYQSLYNQLHNYKRNLGENIKDFNDISNNLVM
jgi:hypothetical protein